MSDVRAQSGVPVTAQFAGITTPSACAPLVVDTDTGIIYSLAAGDVVTASSSTGTVSSVAQTFTGGLISVAGSPITASGTLALTVAGTSGGIPYFSGATTWASSAALAASAIVLGGGAGAAPATTTTGTGVVTALGVNVGTAGAFVVNGGALGTPSSGVGTNITGLDSDNFVGTEWTDLTDAGDSTLHFHSSDRDSANFTGTNWTDLTDGGATTLHTHAYQPLDATLTSLALLGTVADRIAYTTALDTWAETPLTAFARSILDDASEATFKATVNLEIGTDVQAQDAELSAIAGLVSAADQLPYFTGSGAAALATLTAAARTVLDDATTAAMLTTLGALSIAQIAARSSLRI